MENPWAGLIESPTEQSNPWEGLVQAPQEEGWEGFSSKAKQIASERNYPASVLLGQAAIETGRGKHAPGNNYFGIKGGTNNLATKEYDPAKGYYSVNSNFRSYKTPEESINDYIDLIQKTPRYQGAYMQYLIDKDPKKLIEGIRKAGYATSPTYIQSVTSTPEFNQN